MKNQYFGDVTDYLKFGLLRFLSARGQLKILICWMLTPDDSRNDGSLTAYLNDPDQWRSYLPDIFDVLHEQIMINNMRDIQLAEKNHFVSDAGYFTPLLEDEIDKRKAYFQQLDTRLSDYELVFFDPDNGLEIKSTRKGNKNSSKFIYMDEIVAAYQSGVSVLIYQHFARVNRQKFMAEKSGELMNQTEVSKVYAFKTPHVVFFLLLQDQHHERLGDFPKELRHIWQDKIEMFMFE